jgi:hypothetical protein
MQYATHDIRHVAPDIQKGEVSMSTSAPTMPTIGEIARRLCEPVHRIAYVIRARDIQPSGWAGNARVFPDEAVELIAAELQRIHGAKPDVQ